jgi:hypothetical protein
LKKRETLLKKRKVPIRKTFLGRGGMSMDRFGKFRQEEKNRIMTVTEKIDNMTDEEVNKMYKEITEPIIKDLQSQIKELRNV